MRFQGHRQFIKDISNSPSSLFPWLFYQKFQNSSPKAFPPPETIKARASKQGRGSAINSFVTLVQRTALHFGLFLPLLLKISPYGTKSPLCFGTSMFYFGSSLYFFHNLRKIFKYMPSFGLKNVTLSPSLARKNSWIWLKKGIYKQICLEKNIRLFPHPP